MCLVSCQNLHVSILYYQNWLKSSGLKIENFASINILINKQWAKVGIKCCLLHLDSVSSTANFDCTVQSHEGCGMLCYGIHIFF